MPGPLLKWIKRRCAICDTLFQASRHDADYCSPKCRKKASRNNHQKRERREERSASKPALLVSKSDNAWVKCEPKYWTYAVTVQRPGDVMPRVVGVLDTEEQADSLFAVVFDDPANANCVIQIAVARLRRMRLAD